MRVSPQILHSVSKIALVTVFVQAAILGNAWSDVIEYDGTNLAVLQPDPLLNLDPHVSLYSTHASSNNTITVIGTGALWKTTGDAINAPYAIYGGIDIGATSSNSTPAQNGADISSNAVLMQNVAFDWSSETVSSDDAWLYKQALFVSGGGLVFGGLSIGGVGDATGLSDEVSGGNGGIVSYNSVSLSNVSIAGGNAGTTNASSSYTGSPVAGFGGASIFGGVSIGGFGGLPKGHTVSAGGAGGDVQFNSVSLNGVVLNGGAGGTLAGVVEQAAAGVGGMGGGSVFGGLSIGGASGTNTTTLDDIKINQGRGGTVSQNSVVIKNASLKGGGGGNGDYAVATAGGAAGLGGGSVFGGVSIGGVGISYASSAVESGRGGDVIANRVYLENVTIEGATGGNGGVGSNLWFGSGGGGTGGLGGGSVVGGMSIGAAGSMGTYDFSGTDIHYLNYTTGGSGGLVDGNEVVLSNVVLRGAAGGDGGKGGDSYIIRPPSFGTSGGGAGGFGGGSVFGGISIGGSGGNNAQGGSGGNVINNKITLKDVTLIGAAGGSGGTGGQNKMATAFSGEAGKGAIGLDGGSVLGGVSIGGASGGSAESVTGGQGGNTSQNRISIGGKTSISGDVYGGLTIGGAGGAGIDSPAIAGNGGNAINNIISLSGHDISILGALFGGYSINGDGSINGGFQQVMSGNTLNLDEYRGSVRGIYNFENYNWLLPSSVVNNDVLIHITGNDAVNLDHTNHSVAMVNDGNRLNAGDEITMIDKAVGIPAATPTQVTQGQFIIYDVSVKVTDDNRFVLKVNGKTDGGDGGNGGGDTDETSIKPEKPAGYINPRSKAFSEGRIASLAFLNQANDLIATAGIDNIRIMVRANEDEIYRPHFIPFMIANGSTQRYKTGSHVDIDGFNMAVGLATGFETKANHKVTLGSFFEYGHGTYDTYNNFATYGSVHADGDVNYKGGGIFGRMEFNGTGLGRVASLAADQADGLYVEASIRGGKTRNKFDGSNDLIDGEGYRGIYDSKVSYYGGHAAVAYVFNFDEKQALDVYGRYLWMHMDGDTVNIGKDRLHFDKSNSSRMQLGGRYSYAYSQQFKPYIGAAYEYEFDGAISANAYGLSLAEPSLKGSTGIFEAGFLFHPIADNEALSINVNGQGFVGQRQGGGGGAKIKYQF
ncbi:hypothetical protein [Bartonella sp. HY761]|uniref:hypothetical protein n=1 Tax=Bartonella sp. HY761 TaxID=2979330 RepID=UPI002204F9B6|nr:hypothetical protein [Bartonella sp. HY761]UXN06798.1 autotransporter outer membrane beta-barrel domain-containing protein [Bartonella sp. HY761]